MVLIYFVTFLPVNSAPALPPLLHFHCASTFAAWIDINLMVTPTSIPLLLRALHLPSPLDLGIRTATADALIETVSKGMPASDKLALISVLDIPSVLSRLVEFGRENGQVEASEEVERFRTKLGALLNAVGNELCKLIEEVRTSDQPANHYANIL